MTNLLITSSLFRAIIYTCGHVVIAMIVVSTMTGASLWEAGAVALIEPAINGCWYFILDKTFVYLSRKKSNKFKKMR